ncbi:prolyl oligopeptidase family serine peptidase [Krasilnikovia sp. MM14-A1259]|uniref:prolyl oligopeptidase family serine peptidase n=1 Tax=Krasilnikovia sp. MM14-A1259 TaxID=3373539 RepID=UPI00382CFA77
MVDRLRVRGVEVRHDIYPDEGHGMTKTANQIQAWSDVGAFLVAYVGSRPASR